MKRSVVAAFVVALLSPCALALAQEGPPHATPEKEHKWLDQLVGEWDTDAEGTVAPGQPPIQCKGTASIRSLGGFWIVAENKSECMGVSVTGVMTAGYDPKTKKYVGTWVDSMSNHMWKYDGSVENKTLSLTAEGPNMTAPGKMSKYRDAIEIKGKDHLVMTSSMQTDDGKWVTFMTMNYRRKK